MREPGARMHGLVRNFLSLADQLTCHEPRGGVSHDFTFHGFVLPHHPDAAAEMDPSAGEEDKTMESRIMASARSVRSGMCD